MGKRLPIAATYLTGGSIFLVTIDAEPPTKTNRPKDWKEYFLAEAGEYLDKKIPLSAFAKSELPKRNVELVDKAIKAGLVGRSDVEFIPMFNFLYKDSNQMITVGGIFGGKTEKRKIRGSAVADAFYYRPSIKRDRRFYKHLAPGGARNSPEPHRNYNLLTVFIPAYPRIFPAGIAASYLLKTSSGIFSFKLS